AVNALLAVECRSPAIALGYSLSRTNLNTGFRTAEPADFWLQEDHVVRIARRSLNLPTNQKRILVGDEQLSVEGDCRPATRIHKCVMQRLICCQATFPNRLDLFVRELAPEVIFRLLDSLVRFFDVGVKRDSSAGQSSKTHSNQSLDEASLEAVACMLCDPAFLLDPAFSSTLDVGRFQVFAGEWLTGPKQFNHSVSEQRSSRPRLIDARPGQDIRTSGALPNSRISVSCEVRLALFSRFLQ